MGERSGTGEIIDRPAAEVEPTAHARTWASFAGRMVWLRSVDWTPWLLLLVINISLGLRVIWLDQPPGALIFDENYYVNAARVILGLPVAEDAPYHGQPAGIDPNSEHPPGAKLLIAASMWLFGDNALAW